MIRLNEAHIRHLYTGSVFAACMIDPDWAGEQADKVLALFRETDDRPVLCDPGELEPEGLVVAVGFVSNGLPPAELRPVGDEFLRCIALIEQELEQPVVGVMPLAAGGLNGMVAPLVALQAGVPLVDADPMGRVFPLVSQSVFAVAGLPAGPVAATGATGESAMVQVQDPVRVDRLLRALAGVYGGWAATVSYPMTAAVLAATGVQGSTTRLLRIGEILDADTSIREKYEGLERMGGLKLRIRARVSNVGWLASATQPGQTARPSSVTLIGEPNGRILQLEIQDEVLLLMVDGVVRAAVPDIITILDAHDGNPATLEDLWVGNTIDILVMSADAAWYTEAGLRLAGPGAFSALGVQQ